MRQVLLSMQRAITRHRALVAVTLLAAALAALPALTDRILFIKDRGLIEHDPSRGSARALELYNRLYRD